MCRSGVAEVEVGDRFGVYLTGDSFSRNSRSLGSSLLKGSDGLSDPNMEGNQPIVTYLCGFVCSLKSFHRGASLICKRYEKLPQCTFYMTLYKVLYDDPDLESASRHAEGIYVAIGGNHTDN